MKKFAQHFLTNRHAIDRIIETLNPTPDDHVLEIGPGKGALTTTLVGRARHVTVVDVDTEMIEFLKKRLRVPNITIVQADIQEFDLDALRESAGVPLKVLGNLPYNLTSPILRQLCDWTGWTTAIIMVQKEVGQRLVAKVGTAEYGALTAGVSLSCAVEPLFVLSEKSFSPAPRVQSIVLRLTRRDQPLSDNVPRTQRVIQAAFQQRRKTLLNSLSHGLNLSKDTVGAVLEKVGIDPTDRAERVSVAQFVQLSSELL